MYIRSFKPSGAGAVRGGWLLESFAHLAVFAATLLLAGYVVLSFTRAALSGDIAGFVHAQYGAVIATVAGLALLRWFARPRSGVDFDERNAVDVEMMGLYWHFVDIVWIVIFTAVYLLEYIS
jgi:cytochrome o ubiquinol oxidase subunit 3